MICPPTSILRAASHPGVFEHHPLSSGRRTATVTAKIASLAPAALATPQLFANFSLLLWHGNFQKNFYKSRTRAKRHPH